jgi:hypothetical protein
MDGLLMYLYFENQKNDKDNSNEITLLSEARATKQNYRNIPITNSNLPITNSNLPFTKSSKIKDSDFISL